MTKNLPAVAHNNTPAYSNPEEYAALLQADTFLARIVVSTKEDAAYVREANNERDDQFLWGQDFDTNPEVWEELEAEELHETELEALLASTVEIDFYPDYLSDV